LIKDFKNIFVFLKPYWLQELLIFLLISAVTLSNLASPYFLKIIIDDIIPSRDYSKLVSLLILLTGVYIARGLLILGSDQLNTSIGNRIIFDIKTKLFRNLMNMPLTYFETSNAGDTVQKVNNEVDKIQYFLTMSIIRLLNSLLTIISLVFMLCWLDFKMFLFSISVIPISIIYNNRVSKKIKRNIETSGRKEGEIYNFYFERIRNIKLIKTFNSYEYEMNSITRKLRQLFAVYLQNTMLLSLTKNVSGFLISTGPLIVFAYGGKQVINGALSIGALVAFIQYLNRVYGPANDLMSLYVDYVKTHESIRRISPILNSNELHKDDTAPNQLLPEINSLTIKELNFSGNNGKILHDINISFRKGVKYGIVGENGSGKSTLVKLICRLYEPGNGSIVLNNDIDIGKLDRYRWADSITLISQDPSLLSDSIRNNLIYGDFTATDEALWKSLTLVKLDDFVKGLPQKMNACIGNGTESIVPSGGQAQQIAMARAFLKRSGIIILDEAASSIDAQRSNDIMQNFINAFPDTILIVISHRISCLTELDQIIFMEEGRISETGSHTELMRRKGKYFSLFRSQIIEAGDHYYSTVNR
jgi:ABC-type bacteriocin/lantibiotic exporter with double-glycine peptidase domain